MEEERCARQLGHSTSKQAPSASKKQAEKDLAKAAELRAGSGSRGSEGRRRERAELDKKLGEQSKQLEEMRQKLKEAENSAALANRQAELASKQAEELGKKAQEDVSAQLQRKAAEGRQQLEQQRHCISI